MIRLWRHIILPVFKAANIRRILEIGAEAGFSTNVLLKYVSRNQGLLYCIDPSPEFDAEELKSNYPNHFVFYKDLSLNALPSLPQIDAVLIDGDHNWYTVYHELKEVEKIHGSNAIKQPVVFVHDISWPYGRRDLYYNPQTIPEQYCHPHEQKGILPNKSELSFDRGLNKDLWNATHEGGEHNGVLSAVENYLAESKLEFEFLKLPLYFGLGILITKKKLKATDKLKTVLDGFMSYDGAMKLLAQTEHIRCVDAVFAQAAASKLREAEDRVNQLENLLKKTSSGGLKDPKGVPL